VPDSQIWPLWKKVPNRPPSTARSILASSQMMFADFPPSSSVTFLMVSEPIFLICLPTSVEPVNAILSTLGLRHRASPISPPGPVTMFTTPLGMALSAMTSARISALRVVSEAGFRTMELPMIAAWRIFHMAMPKGKFQGMMPTHTPSGSLRM